MKYISGQLLKSMFISASNNLFNHYPEIDALNVFPVPDGDTGMNMNLTMSSGAKEINNRNDNNVSDIAKNFSRGLLMGARGNSGVITSQIFRGFAKSLEGKEQLGSLDLVDALLAGKEASYKAVMRPVEGTILTVIREVSDTLASSNVDKDTNLERCFEIIINEAKSSLERTPSLLPVLKEVGVVDSGAAGLVTILEGMQKALLGEFINKNTEGQQIVDEKEGQIEHRYTISLKFEIYNDGTKKQFIEQHFKDFSLHHGHNLNYKIKDNIMEYSLDTVRPGTILAYLQQFGEFNNISITPHSSRAKENNRVKTPHKQNAIIAVSSGKGLDELFKQIGVDVIVSGGQTMNPSIQDFVSAIKQVNAHDIIILPNNSNVVMAANQACEVIGSDVDARVVPSKTIPQGLVSAMVFDQNTNIDNNFNNMRAALKNVTSGLVTFSIKDTDIEGVHVTKGYYMGLQDKSIITCVKDKLEALRNLLGNMIKKESNLITIICGEDIKEKELKDIQKELETNYPNLQVNVISGLQPVYSFIVGVE